jgi:CRP/FNR family transcriptional regulator, cyclic AMP receptor protein
VAGEDGAGQGIVEDIDARGILAAIPLFAETLNPRQLDHLAAQCEPVFFPAGTFLISEGDFGDSMFAIVEGEASVTLHDDRGEEHGVAQVRPGEVVGEMSILTGMRRKATVIARTDVAALEITKPALEEMFARAPELIDRFGVVLAERQAVLNRVAADAASHKDFASRIRRFFGGK